MTFKIWFFEKKSIKTKGLMIFTRQLATLIEAGFPLLNGLIILSRQEKDPVLQHVIFNLGESVRSGATLAESLNRHPTIFNKLFVNMVHAGEVGGVLAPTFLRLAEFQEKAHKLRTKIIAATAYPLITLLTALTIFCFLLGVIIPKFQSILPDIMGDKPLPPLTIFVTSAGNLFKENFILLLAVLFVCSITFRYILNTQKGKTLFDSWNLQIPLLGNLIRQQAISRFSRTLGTLIANGVPILQALSLTRETISNTKIATAIDKIHQSIQAGESIACPLEASRIFPPLVVSMISVGEETARLPQMLLKIADIYDDEVESAIAGLTSLIEPIIIIFLAFIVGTIVITLFLPIVSIADSFPTL